jgi:hypothetical protein
MKNLLFYFYGISVIMAISFLKCLSNDMLFYINQLGTGPFHNCYIFFEFAEIFVIVKRLIDSVCHSYKSRLLKFFSITLNDTKSHRSARIVDTESRRPVAACR